MSSLNFFLFSQFYDLYFFFFWGVLSLAILRNTLGSIDYTVAMTLEELHSCVMMILKMKLEILLLVGEMIRIVWLVGSLRIAYLNLNI